jgi:hypothetical protein
MSRGPALHKHALQWRKEIALSRGSPLMRAFPWRRDTIIFLLKLPPRYEGAVMMDLLLAIRRTLAMIRGPVLHKRALQ